MTITPYDGGDIAGPAFRGTIEGAELVGADRYVYVRFGSDEVIVRVDARERHQNGMEVLVSLEMDRFLCFDLHSEHRIS